MERYLITKLTQVHRTHPSLLFYLFKSNKNCFTDYSSPAKEFFCPYSSYARNYKIWFY